MYWQSPKYGATMTVALILSLMSTNQANAQTAAELLEKGIFQEETTGDLDEAIKTYRQIVTDSKEPQSVAAQAQFRLAQCLLKQAKQDDAVAAFRELITRFPDQLELVAKAKLHLPEALRLLAPPWKSGERLTMVMKLPNGLPIGIIGTAVDNENLEGKKIWRMTVRRFIASAQNEGVSEMLVDQGSNHPWRTDWQHTVLGNNKALWSDKELVITTPAKEGKEEVSKVVKLSGDAYSNDQWFFGFRQLPLEIGYKTTIPIRVDFTGGNEVGLEVTIAAQESVETPAGTFECFRMDTNIQQTFWITNTPERYPAKFVAGGVTALLQSIAGASEQPLEHPKPLLSVTVPNDWFHFESATKNQETSFGYQLVAPGMLAVEVQVTKKSLLEADERESPLAWGKEKMQHLRDLAKEIQFTNDLPQPAELAGLPGVSFDTTHSVNGDPFVHQQLLAMYGDWALEVHIAGLKSIVTSQQASIDSILKSVRIK